MGVAVTAPIITRPPAPRSGQRIVTANFALGWPSYPPRAVTAEEVVGLDATLVVLDEHDRSTALLPVLFRQRFSDQESIRLFGTDPSGALQVSATITRSPLGMQLDLNYESDASASPRALLPVFRLLRALRRPARLDLQVHGHSVGEPAGMPDDREFPNGWLETTRSLAFVQAVTGTSFPMPPVLDEDDLRDLRDAETLLTGSTVTGQWNSAKLTVAEHGWVATIEGAEQLKVELIGDTVIQIAGHDIALGEATYVFHTAVIDRFADDEVMLRPGSDDTFEMKLLAPPEIGVDLQDVRRPVLATIDALETARARPLNSHPFGSAAS